MASQEALTGPAGRTATVTLRRGRLRIVLVGFIIVVLGSFSLLFLSLTSGSIGIDRSDPRVVIGEFMQALLVDHNSARAQTFMCDQWQAVDATRQLTYSDVPGLVTTWGVMDVATNGDNADAAVEVRSRLDRANHVEYWRFSLIKASDGWRVCSAQIDPSLAPK